MESWIVRQAHANAYHNPSKLAIAYLGLPPQFTLDFDFIDMSHRIFRIVAAHVETGVDSAFQMTLGSFRHVLVVGSQLQQKRPPCAFGRVTPRREGRRFCPLCLGADKTPYLRLVWRLSIAPICLTHKTFLASRCCQCNNDLDPFDNNSRYNLEKCAHCGSPLASTQADLAVKLFRVC
jgi:hypothetical protein